MTLDETRRAEVLALETRVWEALLAGDRAADEALLSEDFLGVYPDGFAGREAHVGQLDAGSTVAQYRLSEITVRDLGAAALIVYRAAYVREGHADWEEMLVSSLWELRDGAWINSFSQDTPLTGDTVV